MALISIGQFKINKNKRYYQLVNDQAILKEATSLEEVLNTMFYLWRKQNAERIRKTAEHTEIKITLTAK